ncbi:hypothetical protein CYLTODRAFT_341124 [Cylindrobasidium torrendii FP15055 ss-10]|uniref:tRNA (guanine(9)-N1)-methyltransferase n=1 Tax=Cylindrobasidium torrendii FP15055 ss-10 TaxID=1314674 RepID=A0A0D7BU32_9AGAR|nr:hypothetical protein CYLTODRAFT_341124 [Cylindrobasidium torrendii FP15055 ss-10]
MDEAGASTTATGAPAMSKNALKKAAKQEKWAATKLARRAREKEAKKEKKKIRAEERATRLANGEPEPENEDTAEKRHLERVADFGGTVVIDLGFDEKMSEREVQSLTTQLAYVYSSNRNSAYPFRLIFTSINGRTKQRLESFSDAAHTRWKGTEWWEEGYEKLWANTSDVEEVKAIKRQVVYLTADTDADILELRPDETYIIGGIVDHNRYKNLCLDKANESGIRTGRLPIGRYLANLPTRKVLTVNQVFDILVRWVEHVDWHEAMLAVMPQRKYHQGNGSKDATKGPQTEMEGELEEVEGWAEEEEEEGN